MCTKSGLNLPEYVAKSPKVGFAKKSAPDGAEIYAEINPAEL